MVGGGQCKTKLVDSCSWPHCNPTCPKLKNPETGMQKMTFDKDDKFLLLLFSPSGQEIDFLTLLSSFGLDLNGVARALGVDLATLHAMDRDILVQMLSSKGGSG